MAFIFIGQVNVLAPIVSINFMLTYSFVDYSYFSVAMTFQLRTKDKMDSLSWTKTKRKRSSRQSSKPLIDTTLPNYGSGSESPHNKGTLLAFTRDMDHIFPPVSKGESGAEKTASKQDRGSRGSKSRRTSAKQKLMDSFGLDLNNDFSGDKEEQEEEEEDDFSSTQTDEEVEKCENGKLKTQHQPELQYPPKVHDNEKYSSAEIHSRHTGAENKAEHQSTDKSFYAKLSNHWIALVGAACSILIMFVIQWVYAVANIVVAFLLYFYIGKVSPGLPKGIAAQFSFFTWLKSTLSSIISGKKSSCDEFVLTPSLSGVGLKTKQLTEENEDFASRDRYHHSSVIGANEMAQAPFH